MNWWYTGWYLWGNDSYNECSFFTLWAENVKHDVVVAVGGWGSQESTLYLDFFFLKRNTSATGNKSCKHILHVTRMKLNDKSFLSKNTEIAPELTIKSLQHQAATDS